MPASVPKPWLASWPPGVPTGWTYPAVPVSRLVDDAIRDVPEGVALVDDQRALDWLRLGAVVDDVARGLASRGPDRVVLDCTGGLTAVVIALATWRLGAVLEVVDPSSPAPDPDAGAPGFRDDGGDDDGGDDGGDAVSGSHPGEPSTEERVLVLADRRNPRAGLAAGGDRAEVVRADVERLVRRRTSRSRLGRAVSRVLGRAGGRITRSREGRGRVDLSTLVDRAGQVTLPPVDPDAPALRMVVGEQVVTASQRQLVAATFQVRLWIPDVATGSEVVGAAIGWWQPGGLVLGILLAALTAGACRVADADDLAAVVPGASLAFADVATWRHLASGGGWRGALLRRRTRGAATGAELRLAGVVVRPGTGLLDPDSTTRLVASTEGARVRHFWHPDEVVGPLLAQPVYGRLAGDPGAVPLVDTVLVVHDGATLAHGPQVPMPAEDCWVALRGEVPLEVVTGQVARPGTPRLPAAGTTWQRVEAPAAPPVDDLVDRPAGRPTHRPASSHGEAPPGAPHEPRQDPR